MANWANFKILLIYLVLSFETACALRRPSTNTANDMKRRLDYIESRLSTNIVSTGQTLEYLTESLSNLTSFVDVLNGSVSLLLNGDPPVVNKPNETAMVNKVSYETETCTRNNILLTKGFASEKMWLKDKIKKTEVLIESLKEHMPDRIDKLQDDLSSVTKAFKEFSDSTRARQEELHTNLRTFSEEMVKENENLRRDLDMTKTELKNLNTEYEGMLQDIENKSDEKVENLTRELEQFKEEMLEMYNSTQINVVSKAAEKPPSSTCDIGWHLFEARCYLYDHSITMTFQAARQFCADHKAYVADFESKEESELIYRLVGDELIWAGITDEETEGEWKSEWTDSAIQYSNWNNGDPDGGRMQNCVLVGWLTDLPGSWHGWIDGPCITKFPFVCKKNAGNA